jgi:hypothetical protein
MRVRARTVLTSAALLVTPAAASAQAPPSGPTTANTAQPLQPPAGPSTPAPSGSASDATPPKPVVPATGYGWGSTKKTSTKAATTKSTARAAHAKKPGTPDAILPGFETLSDGATRFFVELTRTVPYEEKKAAGELVYVLKGAHVDKRNNYNPLVTVHFNTPVTRARLVPHGNDLYFVIDLRANVQQEAKMVAGKEGTAILQIEFPNGDYLKQVPSDDTGSAPPPKNPSKEKLYIKGQTPASAPKAGSGAGTDTGAAPKATPDETKAPGPPLKP